VLHRITAPNARRPDFRYRWRTCDAGGCDDIPHATGDRVTLTEDLIGTRLRVEAIATTTSGTATAASEEVTLFEATGPTAEGKLAYLSHDRSTLYISDPDGTHERQLARCSALLVAAGSQCSFSRPQISPNGLMVAVHQQTWSAWSDPVHRIVVMNADGTAQRVAAAGLDPAWMMDSAELVFTATSNSGATIKRARADGSHGRAAATAD
jgi:hypothetical protein